MNDSDFIHGQLDARLSSLEAKVDEIGIDVKSLLVSRSFLRGAWLAIVAVAGAVSTVISLVTAWLRH